MGRAFDPTRVARLALEAESGPDSTSSLALKPPILSIMYVGNQFFIYLQARICCHITGHLTDIRLYRSLRKTLF